jgi:DNA-binding NtrC family response regulator
MSNAPPLILVVEDDYDVRTTIAQFLEDCGYRLALANEISTGEAILNAVRPILVITDIRMRGGSGLDLAKLAQEMGVPALLISGEPTTILEHRNGPTAFLQKPFRFAELAAKIEEIIGSRPS